MSQPHTAQQAGNIAYLGDDDQQFRLLVQSITDYAIYMLDPQGYIRNWNPGGQRIKGYSREEIIGQHFSRFYTEEDRAAGLPEHGLRVAREEGRYQREGWRLRKDGTRFWASVVIDPIWKDERLVGFAKITRDITDRHEAQQRLEQSQRALAQSQKIEAVGKLTFGLAHDFNNLLTVVINSLEMIPRRLDDPARVQSLVDGAVQAADRGALLTRQLLAFARGQDLLPERHEASDLLRRSEALYRRACGPGVRMRFDLADGLPPVLVDAAQFEAAVLNLVVNGRDAIGEAGTITIATALEHRTPPPVDTGPQRNPLDCVVVTVSDDGPGMEESVRERAIEPFFTTKDTGKGSGLGLSQVYGFATQSGGFVDLRSAPGAGTQASIVLPVAPGAPR